MLLSVAVMCFMQWYGTGVYPRHLGRLTHTLGSRVVLVKCPNSRFSPLAPGSGPREMAKFDMSTLFGPVLAAPHAAYGIEL